jgi:DNA-binding MarR family transcriptional regulator
MVNDREVDALAVATRLRPVLLRLNRELRRELAPLGVTGGQAAILHLIERSPGVGVRELALRENMSPAGMSGHVERLGTQGLVRREPSATDRRRIGLFLTEEGRRVLRSVRSRRTAWLSARLRRLPPDELRAVEAAIGPLAALLEEDRS